MHDQNADSNSRIRKLCSVPLRPLKVEQITFQAKQEILSKFMHLKQGDTARIPPVRMELNSKAIRSGSYSIRVVTKG
jgi:hypothetical protein